MSGTQTDTLPLLIDFSGPFCKPRDAEDLARRVDSMVRALVDALPIGVALTGEPRRALRGDRPKLKGKVVFTERPDGGTLTEADFRPAFRVLKRHASWYVGVRLAVGTPQEPVVYLTRGRRLMRHGRPVPRCAEELLYYAR